MTLQTTTSCRGEPGSIAPPSFLVAMAVLVAGAVLAGPVADWMKVRPGKQALLLRAPLSRLGDHDLAPYKVLRRTVLEPLYIEALGTDRYLCWRLEDQSVEPADPVRWADLIVTYYSGGRNLVPHTPDVCYLGSGYQPAQPHENVDFDLPALGSNSSSVPVRVCTFAKTAVFDHQKITVVYTFNCNGGFVGTRTGVRLSINAPLNTYAYFSKVEVSFPRATRSESIAGAKRLFDRVLPLLVKYHWPDFEGEELAAREQVANNPK